MEIMNNNYYPSVKICNNELQEKTNNSLLERRFIYKDMVIRDHSIIKIFL